MARGIVTGGLNSAGSNIKSVQRGSLASLSATTTNITIPAVNLANSIVIIDFIIDGAANNANASLIQGKLTSSTNLQINVGAFTTKTYIEWQVIEFQNVKSIQKGDLVTTTGPVGSTYSATISSINTAKSRVFASAYSTSSTAGSNPSAFSRITAQIASSTSLVFRTSGSETNINWQVVEFY